MLPVLFRRKLRLILTADGITDIITEGITTDITITVTTIGTGLGLSASMGAQGITAIGNRSSKDHFSGPLNIRNDTKIGCILSCFFECFVGKPSNTFCPIGVGDQRAELSGNSETEGKAATGSGERARVASEFQIRG